MALVVPNVSEVEFLSRALKNENATLRLYTNDYTPVKGSVIGSFTEAAVSGYAAKTLASGSWSISTSGTISYAEQEFLPLATMSGYGYYVVNAAGTIPMWAERFTGAPYSIPSTGGSIKVMPTLTVD
jgi:hypothetical protein